MRNRGTKAPPPKVRVVIDNTELVAAFRAEGGVIYHHRPFGRRRGVTFAFIPKNNRVEVATAVTHTADTFCKKNGCKTAIENFRAGKKIVMPITRFGKESPTQTVIDFLKYLL